MSARGEAQSVVIEVATVPVPDRPRGILALDIDGTLLGPDGKLSDRTVQAVHQAGAAGWLVTLATGRRWGATVSVAEEVGLQVPLVCYNGALVRHATTGDVLHYLPLTAAPLRAMLGKLIEHGLQPVLYQFDETGEHFQSGPEAYDSPIIQRWLESLTGYTGEPVRRLEYAELVAQPSATRAIVYDLEERVRWLEDLPGAREIEGRVLFYEVDQRAGLMAELLHPLATKATGLRVLAEHFGLTLADVIAVGDGSNDVEMLAEAGVGVAMGQAPPTVQAEARLTIGDYANDGLAEFIERVLLDGQTFPAHLRALDRRDGVR